MKKYILIKLISIRLYRYLLRFLNIRIKSNPPRICNPNKDIPTRCSPEYLRGKLNTKNCIKPQKLRFIKKRIKWSISLLSFLTAARRIIEETGTNNRIKLRMKTICSKENTDITLLSVSSCSRRKGILMKVSIPPKYEAPTERAIIITTTKIIMVKKGLLNEKIL